MGRATIAERLKSAAKDSGLLPLDWIADVVDWKHVPLFPDPSDADFLEHIAVEQRAAAVGQLMLTTALEARGRLGALGRQGWGIHVSVEGWEDPKGVTSANWAREPCVGPLSWGEVGLLVAQPDVLVWADTPSQAQSAWLRTWANPWVDSRDGFTTSARLPTEEMPALLQISCFA